MEHITQYLLHSDMPTEQCEHLMKLIGEYGKQQWMSGWNKAIDTAGYGTPPEPSVRNEVRNTPIVNNQIGQL